MSHQVWDDSRTATAAPFECRDCGDSVYVVVEFIRNNMRMTICFDCIRDAAKDVADHIADHGEPRT